MIGILTEKPSAMRNFEKALGASSATHSGTFNGESYMLTCARGHLYSFVPPEAQVDKSLRDRYKSWNVENLPWDEKDFKWTYEPNTGVQKELSQIKKVLSQCDEIVIATDDDPTGEGELLAWEILSELKLRPKKWSRMYFEDESVKELQKSFKNRKAIASMHSDKDYIKAFYRARWDFLSMQWTRIATKVGDGKSVLREGRLKSAMVLLVGDQLKAVAAYKKIPYYQNRFKDENGIVYISANEPSYPKKEDVPKNYHDSDVIIDDKSMKSTVPPKMLDLAGLASRLSHKYPSKLVSDVYQKMYEAQIVSYPRTEDKVISPEQFNDLLPLVDSIAAVVGVDPKLLTHRTPRSTHVKTGQAHGANRPGTTVPKSLADLAKFGTCAADIYQLLATNYLATLAEDYEYEFQKGHLADYPDFKGTASVPKKQGWKAVYSDEDIADDDAKGLGIRAKPFIHEGFPPKPTAPTMKWLMKQLEKYDVGTGATRVTTYSEITDSKTRWPILKDTRGKITMTEYGNMSYRLLPGTNIGSLAMTEQLYADMKDIANGKKNPESCLADIQRMIREDIIIMKQNGEAMRKELNIMSSSNNDVERYEGTWNGQSVKFKRVWSGHTFTDDECEKLCNGEEIEIEAVSAKTGKSFKCRGVLAEQEFKGKTYVGFQSLGFVNSSGSNNNGGGIPDEWCQHKFTDDEKSMLEAGLSVACDDFVSKKGSKFSAKVHYGKNDRGYMGIIPEF